MPSATAEVLLLRNRNDAIGMQPQVEWAIGYAMDVLKERSLDARAEFGTADVRDAAESPSLRILLGGPEADREKEQENREAIALPQERESYAIRRCERNGTCVLSVAGRDAQGLMYAVLELADVARYAENPIEALSAIESHAASPANRVRSITRLFTSEPEDKPWFYDKSFWDDYLTELATNRFNRITFSVGAGYDYLIDRVVLDSYFCFFYPYVISVPGYEVRVEGLPDAERERNLEMLRYIGSAAKLRGLEFRLGLWNHAYDYGSNNTHKAYRIAGLDEHNHAAYCRDALAQLLQSCPDISGLTFRVHFEGGVPEPTHHFWRTVLERVGEADNLEEIDFHSKGVGEELIDIAGRTGKRVVLSTKGWGEHMGPPYHQASIRGREFGRKRPERNEGKVSFYPPSTGNHDSRVGGMEMTSKRSYSRYSYADLLRDDRPYDMIHRYWPGTQRILLWGDPAIAARIGAQYAGFQGSLGVEWFDPLSFKGKKGSGSPGERELYEDDKLRLAIRDWTKFRYTYRLWGRLAYNPEAHPEEWRRYLRSRFGEAAESCERSLAYASKILPFVTLVHAPSVANNVYWPEMYTNIPLVRGEEKVENPFASSGWPANADFDMEPPYCFMNVSPLDPIMIYRVNEFAEDAVEGRRRGKLAPHEVADRLEAMADQALHHLQQAEAEVRDPQDADFIRLAADVRIMAGTGRFFADKFRAGLALALYDRAGGQRLPKEALERYRAARRAWQDVVAASAGVYKSDITFGHTPYSRGHWSDRLAAIDEDIAAVESLAAQAKTADSQADVRGLSDWLNPADPKKRPACLHIPALGFVKGQPAEVRLELEGQGTDDAVVRLRYRHVNQAESYQETIMERQGGGSEFAAVIPAEYTESPYALQYFFEIGTKDGDAWMSPGIDEALVAQPYYVLNATRRSQHD